MPTFDTPEPIVASISLSAGNVHITASDRADTVVEVRPSSASDEADVRAARETRVEYDQATGRLLVKGPAQRARWFLGLGASIDVTVELPTDSRVEVSAAANVVCQGRLGDCKVSSSYGEVRLDQTGRLRLSTASGDVSVGRTAGHAEVSTGNGEIRIREIDGSAVVKAASGAITVGEVTGDLRLTSASGDIEVDRALASVVAKTAYGSVRIGEVVRSSVVVETAYGDLTLGVREGTAAWLDLTSQYGEVRSFLTECEGPGQSDETVKVRARTGYGDVVVRRS